MKGFDSGLKDCDVVMMEEELPMENKVSYRKAYFLYVREVLTPPSIIYWKTIGWHSCFGKQSGSSLMGKNTRLGIYLN